MRLKLISSLLVLCLAFSIGSALASDTSGSMYKSMGGKMMAGKMDKMAGDMDQATIIVAGKVSGTVTVNKMTGMAGMAGGMGSAGKTMTRKFSGNMIVVKDISNKTETTMMIGKMDGMTKRVVMIGESQYKSGMSGKNAGMTEASDGNTSMADMSDENADMADTSDENTGMTGMTGSMDNKVGAMDNDKVVVTGDITCMTVGKMVVLGQPSDLKEMSSENAGMAETSDENASMAETSDENASMTETSDENANMTETSDENDSMVGTSENMDNMAGTMENRSVIATASIRCNMNGKMIIIGKLGDIKKEMMAGSEKKGMKGVAAGKAGAVGYSTDNMQGAIAGKAGVAGFSNDNMKGVAAGKAGAAGVSTDNMQGVAVGKTGVAGVSNDNMKGIAAGRAGVAGISKGGLTIIMTGITRCKITGINMVVIGKMGKMTGTRTGGMMAGMKESKAGMMAGMKESKAGTTQQ
jgi:hypothetical protein